MGTVIFCVCLLLAYGLVQIVDAKICRLTDTEPPLVRPKVPFVGHILGMMRHGVSYYKTLRENTNLPIFTMFLASQKVYVVNSPGLISQINRRQKAIDGDSHFLAIALGKLFGLHGEDLAEVLRNPCETGSLRRDTKAIEHGTMERGVASFNEVYTNVMSDLADRLNNLALEGAATTVHLRTWLQEAFTLSTAHAVFGPRNPFIRYAGLHYDFWMFASDVKGLTMNTFPSTTATGPFRARERLFKAFREFCEDGSAASNEASAFVRQLNNVAGKHDRGIEYLTHYFFALFSAFILNTVPTAFWTIGRIVENRELVAGIRAELVDVLGPAVGKPTLTIDASVIRERCPLFASTFNEILRYVGSSISTLVVHEDVWIEDDRYLLKKGSWVQIPATAVHTDPEIWGKDAGQFNPERFLKPFKVHPAASRTFGGGSTLCPGRHLATDEILAFTAMLLYTFDVDYAAGSRLPPRDEVNMLPVMKPVNDIVLGLSRRQDMGNVSWGFQK